MGKRVTKPEPRINSADPNPTRVILLKTRTPALKFNRQHICNKFPTLLACNGNLDPHSLKRENTDVL